MASNSQRAANNQPATIYQPIHEQYKPDMNSKLIKSKFPLTDRIAMACQCCGAKGDTIEQLLAKKELFKFEEEFKGAHHKDLGLKLKVKETGSLLLDPNVTHPFVRIHVVDMNTCKYLAKSDLSKPDSYNKESVQVMDDKGALTEKPVDFILPLSTKFFDMRIKGQTQCTWDESFIINELA